MKTLFVVSDVHSYFNEMKLALDTAGFDIYNKDHIFISCGDLLDRGPDPLKCLEFVNSLEDDRKKLILGNHEDLLIQACFNERFDFSDRHNKTDETVYKVTGIKPISQTDSLYVDQAALSSMRENKEWNKYIYSCENYFEINDYVFVHGYIPVLKDGNLKYNENWRNEFSNWQEARWLNGMSMWKLGIREPNKTIVCGHWHSSYGHARIHKEGNEFEKDINGNIKSIHTPFYDNGIIAIDACTPYSGFVNCIKLEVEDE